MQIAYPSTPVHVLLDGGSETEDTSREIRRTHRDRVDVHQLPSDEIEKLFHVEAIARWLRDGGAPQESVELSQAVGMILQEESSAKRALHRVARQMLRKRYREVDDAREIARRTLDVEVPALITGVLTAIVNQEE